MPVLAFNPIKSFFDPQSFHNLSRVNTTMIARFSFNKLTSIVSCNYTKAIRALLMKKYSININLDVIHIWFSPNSDLSPLFSNDCDKKAFKTIKHNIVDRQTCSASEVSYKTSNQVPKEEDEAVFRGVPKTNQQDLARPQVSSAWSTISAWESHMRHIAEICTCFVTRLTHVGRVPEMACHKKFVTLGGIFKCHNLCQKLLDIYFTRILDLLTSMLFNTLNMNFLKR
ncbi:hypothetical protein CsatB_022857 [Cannabis sativa]